MAFNNLMEIPANFPFGSQASVQAPADVFKVAHTPMTTGTSVLGVKFDKGVILAADMLGSYGSLARFRLIDRIFQINKQIIVGAGGDYADYQYLNNIIKQKVIDETCLDDGFLLKPRSLHCWVTRVLYNRRSKFDPLWTNFVVAGIQDGEPFLGSVDKLGMAYESTCIGTGYGGHLAIPLMRDALEKKPNLTEQEARDVLNKCMQVLFYRDARAFDKYQVAIVTAEGVNIISPIHIQSDWCVAEYKNVNN